MNTTESSKFLVVGIGGFGCWFLREEIRLMVAYWGMPKGTAFAVVNTDRQDLEAVGVAHKLHIGPDGNGTGGVPERGFAAADASREQIAELVRGAEVVLIIAGMGGGTGTGAAPVIAEEAQKQGILVIALVTYPAKMEGERQAIADRGLRLLVTHVAGYQVMRNQDAWDNLPPRGRREMVQESIRMATRRAMTALHSMVCDINDPNIDAADLRRVATGGTEIYIDSLAMGWDEPTSSLLYLRELDRLLYERGKAPVSLETHQPLFNLEPEELAEMVAVVQTGYGTPIEAVRALVERFERRVGWRKVAFNELERDISEELRKHAERTDRLIVVAIVARRSVAKSTESWWERFRKR